jgi:N-succinyl-L-ornithine transcarbamylase
MNYISIQNIDSPDNWVKQALKIKRKASEEKNWKKQDLRDAVFNPSLRTRLSTQKAA